MIDGTVADLGRIFDLKGRVVAVFTGMLGHNRIELFRKHWGFVAADEPVDVISSEPLATSQRFFAAWPMIFPIVAEVLRDNKQDAVGTAVQSDGRALTKASELYGAISRRLADGRFLPATIEKLSRAHYLAK